MRCFYVLEGLDSATCPECGRAFNIDDPVTFTRKPPFLRWVFWMPGFFLAVGGGLFLALVLMMLGNWGFALWVVVPFSTTAVLTYRFRGKWVFIPLLVVLFGCMLVFGLITLDMTGVFCGLTFGLVLTLPAIIGAAAGVILRAVLKASMFSQRAWLPCFVLLALPLIIGIIEGRPSAFNARTVSTTKTIDAPPNEVWQHLVFYEQIQRPRPLLLCFGLPTPRTTEGAIYKVGDVTRCLYSTGTITKAITELQSSRSLGFVVIEQDIHFEHEVRLVSGGFLLEQTDAGGTQITLTTVYEPLVAPRFVWQPIETLAVRTLHEHVIEDIRLHAETSNEILTMAEADDVNRH